MSENANNNETVTDSIRELLAGEHEAAYEYLKESFLTEAMLALFHARRNAGLTQAQLADKLKTKQSAIARLEADFSGSVSLRRYIEFAVACGMLPLDIQLEPAQSVLEFAKVDPEAPRTAETYDAWRSTHTWRKLLSGNTARPIPPLLLSTNTVEIGYDVAPGYLLADLPPEPAVWQKVGRLAPGSLQPRDNSAQPINHTSMKVAV